MVLAGESLFPLEPRCVDRQNGSFVEGTLARSGEPLLNCGGIVGLWEMLQAFLSIRAKEPRK